MLLLVRMQAQALAQAQVRCVPALQQALSAALVPAAVQALPAAVLLQVDA